MTQPLHSTNPADAGTTRSTIRIERATERDLPVILQMIRELAEYERMASDVVATEDGLREALFGPRRYAEVLLASRDEEIAGFALFFHNFSTFLGRPGLWLEDLFVRPPYRRMGCGKALLRALAGIARERGCGRFEWAVLDWNTHAIDFYESLGASVLPDWRIVRVIGPALDALAKNP